MIIVLDANILLQDPALKDDVWERVRFAQAQGTRVVVPAIARMEYEKHRALDLAKHITTLEGLSRSVFSSPRDHLATEIAELKQEQEHLPQLVQEMINDAQLLVEDVPATLSHLDVAKRAVQPRRPFGERDAWGGYRDTLIWLTVLDVARRHTNEETVLVSNDIHAFGNPKDKQADKETLHPELLQDLEEAGLNDRVRWVNSLHAVEFPEDPRPEVLRTSSRFLTWLHDNRPEPTAADLQSEGFPEGATVAVTPIKPLSLISSIHHVTDGIQHLSFTLIALSDVDVSPLHGWVKNWYEPDRYLDERPFTYEGTAEYDEVTRTFRNIQFTRVTVDRTYSG